MPTASARESGSRAAPHPKETVLRFVSQKPLPKGWETKKVLTEAEMSALEIPDVIFEHRAVLYTDGLPFSEVHEVYQRQLLAFPPPQP